MDNVNPQRVTMWGNGPLVSPLSPVCILKCCPPLSSHQLVLESINSVAHSPHYDPLTLGGGGGSSTENKWVKAPGSSHLGSPEHCMIPHENFEDALSIRAP